MLGSCNVATSFHASIGLRPYNWLEHSYAAQSYKLLEASRDTAARRAEGCACDTTDPLTPSPWDSVHEYMGKKSPAIPWQELGRSKRGKTPMAPTWSSQPSYAASTWNRLGLLRGREHPAPLRMKGTNTPGSVRCAGPYNQPHSTGRHGRLI